jgi:tRNA dimethylallyltransferase
MDKDLVVVLTGPTGIGKTGLSIELSKIIKRTEIVSSDSMAVYKGMDIGTSKPSGDVRLQVPHHMIDIVDYSESFDVAEYVKRASIIIDDIFSRGGRPLIVGGSLMYLYSLLDGIFKGPSRDNRIRARLIKEAEENGLNRLYDRLKEVDSEAALKIHPNDLKRIVRALEVYELTGRKISELKRDKSGISSKYRVAIFALCQKRAKIYEKIDSRVDKMLSIGLLKEVESLAGRISPTAYQGAGYKELIGYINGEYGLDEALRLIKRNSRRLSKRQLSWLKRDKRVEWIDISEFNSDTETAHYISKRLREL